MGDSNLVGSIASILEASLPENGLQILEENDTLYQELKSTKETDWLYDGVAYLEKLSHFAPWQDYFIVIAKPYVDLIFLKNFNRVTHELDIPWMNVAVDGPFLFVGPIFAGKEPPCFECLEKRLMMNLRESASYQRYKDALLEGKVETNSFQLNKVVQSLIASHAAFDILNYTLTGSAFTIRKLLSIYLPTMEISFNDLLPLSSCQICGPTIHKTDQALYFDMQTLLETK